MKIPDFQTLKKVQALHHVIYVATATLLGLPKSQDGAVDKSEALGVFAWYNPDIVGLNHYIDLVEDSELHGLLETEYTSYTKLQELVEKESNDPILIRYVIDKLVKSTKKLEEFFHTC